MWKRRLGWLLALSGLVVLLAAGAVLLWPLPHSSRLTRENIRSLHQRLQLALKQASADPFGA